MAGAEIGVRTGLASSSSRGFGRGVAPRLAECGVRPIAVRHPTNREAAEEAARLLRARGAGPVLVRADVTGAEDIARMLADDRSAAAGPDLDAALRPRLAAADAAFVADGIALGLPLAWAEGAPRSAGRRRPAGAPRTLATPSRDTGGPR